jgi:methionyl-tRNA synthetase
LEQNNSLQNTIKDLIPKIGNTNTNSNNINSNNKNFNICLFLNENCKDALSMEEFVKKIEVSLTDLLFTKQKGIVNGISNILIKNLNDLPEKKRPLWCSDKKRKKIFVKEEEEWAEDVDNIKTKRAIKDVSSIQVKNINKYTEKHPDWKEKENKKEEYINIVKNATTDIREKDEDIINKLVESIYLDSGAKKLIE